MRKLSVLYFQEMSFASRYLLAVSVGAAIFEERPFCKACVASRINKNNDFDIRYKLSFNFASSLLRLDSNTLSETLPYKFRRTLAIMAIDKGIPIEQV